MFPHIQLFTKIALKIAFEVAHMLYLNEKEYENTTKLFLRLYRGRQLFYVLDVPVKRSSEVSGFACIRL